MVCHRKLPGGAAVQNLHISSGSSSLATGEQHSESVIVFFAGCRSDQFQCIDGACIDVRRKCDGQWDCEGGEDEDDCGTALNLLADHP